MQWVWGKISGIAPGVVPPHFLFPIVGGCPAELTVSLLLLPKLKIQRAVLAAALTLALGARLPALAAEDSLAADDGGVKYTVEVTGAPNSAVSRLIKQSSQLEELRKKLPATAAALARRVRGDEDRFRAILESEGFYASEVTSTIEDKDGTTHVEVVIDAGPQYIVTSLELEFGERDSVVALLPAKTAPINAVRGMIGKPARAADVIRAEHTALDILRRQGFPFTGRGDREVVVDHATRTISIVLPIFVGRKATYGTTFFNGQTRLKAAYLQRLVPWKPGETYDRSELDRFRQSLVRSTLFSSVRVAPAKDEEAPDGAPLDVNVDVTEGPNRTIGATATYARDAGFGGSVYWQHRNLFGNAEILDVSVDGNQLAQTAKAGLTKPNWRRLDQNLRFTSMLQRSTTQAFDGLSAELGTAVDRRISEHWVVGVGVSTQIARLTEDGVRRRSLLLGLPLAATRYVSGEDITTQRSLIDSNNGWRLSLAVTPYTGTYNDKVTFVRSEAEGDIYVPINALRTTVIAARLKLGSIAGSATDNIPADRRFYAGGGGSIRGYGYQLVSPLDASGKPVGGRSLIETSLEARFRFTNTLGLVPFVDAGSVSNSSIPGKDVSLRAAVGLGLRYYTSVGPLRVDLATPIAKRQGIDNTIQFYISFGQAF